MRDWAILDALQTRGVLAASWLEAGRSAVWGRDWASFLSPETAWMLTEAGWLRPYRHQETAVRATLEGRDVALTTGTGSGKSAVFLAPTLELLRRDASATVLMLFPTKALLRDQERRYRPFFGTRMVAIDGDAGRAERQRAYGAGVLLCTPDMLHVGILPRNSAFASFLGRLQLVCLDEAHGYHGLFGSHVANVLRRLYRFAPTDLRVVLASATSANAEDHALMLTGRRVVEVSGDDAAAAPRWHGIINPPIVDARLGIRADALDEALRAAEHLVRSGLRGVLFVSSRMLAERAALRLRDALPEHAGAVFAYRSGLLVGERRLVEESLRAGTACVVVSTSALELGVDFEALDFVVHVGYPGSVAAYRQRAGRAGRRHEGLSLLVAAAGALDQYVAQHPEYLQGGTERLVSDPDNAAVLLAHVRCALYEAAFTVESVVFPHQDAILELLSEDGEAVRTRSAWRALSLDYPAAEVGLRQAGQTVVAKHGDRPVATASLHDATWLWHPDAVYVHAGRRYVVRSLDLEAARADLHAEEVPWFTTSVSDHTTEERTVLAERPVTAGTLGLAEVMVRTQVTGFARRSWESGERLGGGDVDMPPMDLHTVAVSFRLRDDALRAAWGADPNAYGPTWAVVAAAARERDAFRCVSCGTPGRPGRVLDVHHVRPFRAFERPEDANAPENLVTLCPSCHRKAEEGVRIRSGVAAFCGVLRGVVPAFLRCAAADVGVLAESADGTLGFALYDRVSGGVGLSAAYFEVHEDVVEAAHSVLVDCACEAGCPGCVGPPAADGSAGKAEALLIAGRLR